MSKREAWELIHKAERSLRAAGRLLHGGDPDFAISRAYYAMFYAARALLLTREVRRSKHSAVIAAFNSEFIRTGSLSRDLFALLRDGFEDRAEGDYGLVAISDEQATLGIAGAERFVSAVKSQLTAILGTEP